MSELNELRAARYDALEIVRVDSSDDEQVVSLTRQLQEIVEQQYARKSRRGLKTVADEIVRWAREIAPETSDQVQRRLRGVSGATDSSAERKLESILSRRRIRNDLEYKVVLDRVEQIYTHPEEQETVLQLNELLADYLRRRKAKS